MTDPSKVDNLQAALTALVAADGLMTQASEVAEAVPSDAEPLDMLVTLPGVLVAVFSVLKAQTHATLAVAEAVNAQTAAMVASLDGDA